MDEKCFIWEDDLDKAPIVEVKEGLHTLIAKSLERDDGNHTLLRGKTFILVHRECRRKYTNTSRGNLAFKNLTKKRPMPFAQNYSPPSHKIRKHSIAFTFSKHCFTCTKKIKREIVNRKLRTSHATRSPHFKENFIKMLEKINDVGAKVVRRRIELVDLLAEKQSITLIVI